MAATWLDPWTFLIELGSKRGKGRKGKLTDTILFGKIKITFLQTSFLWFAQSCFKEQQKETKVFLAL